MRRGRSAILPVVFVCVATTAWAGISGRVLSSESGPVSGATIDVFAPETADGRAHRLTAGSRRAALASARSAADGSFRLDSSHAVVELAVHADGFAPSFESAVTGGAVTVELKPAESRRGIVTAQGKPVADAIVIWRGGPDDGEIIVRSGKDGSYAIPDPDVWAAGLVVIHPDFALLEASRERERWASPLRHELHAGVPIEGTVIDEQGRRAVVGATLWVGVWPLGRSAEGGAFLIRHAASGWESVVARKHALVGTAKPAHGRIVIHAGPARALSGVVRDARTGEPVAGAVVTLHSDRWPLTSTAASDARGHYAFSSLAAASYGAYVVRAGYTPSFGEGGEPRTIDLRKSLSLERDFALTRLRRLAGRVEDEERKPIDAALVALGPRGAPNTYSADLFGMGGGAARTAPDGSFALDVPPGFSETDAERSIEMSLLALKEGYAAGRLDRVELGAVGRPLVVTLTRGVEIEGRVGAADGGPLSGVAVALAEEGSYATPMIHAALARFDGAGWTKSDANGRFAARVHPMAHGLAFRKHGYAPKVVRGYDPSSGSLEVVLDPAAEVRGHVVRSDGSGVAEMSIYVQRRESGMASATTETDGSFVIEDLAPGPYEVLATKEGSGIRETRSVEAPVSDLRIELTPTGTIRGRVVDARNHEPVLRFLLTLSRGSEGDPTTQEHQQNVSDAGGAFVIGDVAAGEVALTVRAEGYTAKRIDGVDAAGGGETTEVEIALDAGATIRGHVTTKDGEALSDVAVSVATEDGGESSASESDENGDYEVKGVRPGEARLEFRRRGFLTARKAINAAEATRVDATLARGLSVRGVVLSGGAAVARANVFAQSSVADAEPQYAATDRSGRFTIDGLAQARYSITATAEGGEAKLEDVDVEGAGSLRLVLVRPRTAVLSGTVSGLPTGDDVAMAMVFAQGEEGRSASEPVQSNGTFRMERAPVGRVKVRAYVQSLSGAARTGRASELTLTPGTETQAVIEFGGDLVITGSVTRAGAPVPGAAVSFQRGDGDEGGSTARTRADGRYEAGGLEPGLYRVGVAEAGISFDTEYLVTDTGILDIDVTGASLKGRALDAGSGAPVAGVEISLWLLGGRENEAARSVTANTKGEFAAQSLREGRYRLLTAKGGYGQQTRELDLSRGSTSEVVLELLAAEGVSVQVVDARDGRALDATVVVRDLAKRIVANRHSDVRSDGTVTIALADGPYLLSTSANGYGTATIPLTAPGNGFRVGLTPGGTLIVESERDLRGRIRLVQPNGEEYVRCWCNGIADIQVKGRRTTVPNITPGGYTVEIVGDLGTVSGGASVVTREGQVSTVRID